MKVIFLDIDGVLYTDKALKLDKETNSPIINFDSKSLLNLYEIVKKTDAKIVISSSRKVHKKNNWFLWLQIIENLKKFEIDKNIIDTTPVLQNQPRWAEIKSWIDSNNGLNIESYVIIDDEWDMWELSTSFVRCSHFIWISEENKDKAIEILSTKDF